MQSIIQSYSFDFFCSLLLGEYQKSCTECAACPAGSFTTGLNQEGRCSRCSGDCRPSKEAVTHSFCLIVLSVTSGVLQRAESVFICLSSFSFIYLFLSPVFHLKVIQNCTNKSNVKCVCEEGYTCIDMVPLEDSCRYCRKLQETTTAGEY